jgi:hypothetical protein
MIELDLYVAGFNIFLFTFSDGGVNFIDLHTGL